MTAINIAMTSGFPSVSAPTVTLVDSGVSWSSDFTTYAMVSYDADGNEYQNSTASTSTTTGTRGTPGTNWLTTGSASGAWVERTINSGSLWTDGITSGRVQMTSDRTVGVRDTNSASGGVSCNLTVRMYDAASGGNLLDTGGAYTLSATYFNPCPFCCFTPDTMITMAWGGVVPIKDVKVGDEIVVYDPANAGTRQWSTEKVEEIITRVNRAMFKVTFEDGTYLHMSDDHPLHIPGQGPAAISPTGIYKDLGNTVKKLRVGDFVTHINGDWNESAPVITSIEYDEYFGKVYTFSNKYFIANGKVAY